MGSDETERQAGTGPVRDLLADYVLAPEQRKVPPTSPLLLSQESARARLNAELEQAKKIVATARYSPGQPRRPSDPLPNPSRPGAWPPPIYDQPDTASEHDPLLTMSRYVSPAWLGQAMMVCVCVFMIVAGIGVGVIITGGSLDIGRSVGFDLLGLIGGAASLGATGFFLAWLHRAHRNIRAFQIGGITTTPFLAVVSWFIPVVNLVWPYLIVSDVWKASDPDVRIDPLRPHEWKSAPFSPLIVIWWISNVVPIIIDFLHRQSGEGPTPLWKLTVAVWAIVFPALTMLLVHTLSSRQDQKIATINQ